MGARSVGRVLQARFNTSAARGRTPLIHSEEITPMYSEEHRMIRDTLREYARERLAPHAASRDRTHEFPRKELSELGQLGAMGITVPEEYGGSGLDYRALALALEEIAVGDGAVSWEDGSTTVFPEIGERIAEWVFPWRNSTERKAGMVLMRRE